MAATTVAIAEQKKETRIPDYLVKEVIDGIPVYYKGYRDVLNKTKKSRRNYGGRFITSHVKNVAI